MKTSSYSLLCILPLVALALVLIAADGSVADTAADSLVRHVMIEPATAETPRSDTASVAELADGRLMVVYHKYEKGRHAGKDHGFCRIWSKVSDNGGETWKDPRMLVDVEPGDVSVMMPAITKLRDGGLLLICQRIHSPYGREATMLLFRSGDDGASFVEQPPIWRRRSGFPIQGGAGTLVELSSGRLLLPYHAQGRPKMGLTVWCQLSDDQGKTWRRSNGSIELPKRGAMEASVAELADGSLLMSLRTQLGGPYLSRSTNGGVTWSEATFSGLEGGESCTCLRRIPGTKDIVLFWNNSTYNKKHHHFGERTPLAAALSSDDGKSWQIIGNIADDPQAEYTNLDCLFTSQGDAVLTYMHAKPAWNRNRIHVKAALIPRSWFSKEAGTENVHRKQ